MSSHTTDTGRNVTTAPGSDSSSAHPPSSTSEFESSPAAMTATRPTAAAGAPPVRCQKRASSVPESDDDNPSLAAAAAKRARHVDGLPATLAAIQATPNFASSNYPAALAYPPAHDPMPRYGVPAVAMVHMIPSSATSSSSNPLMGNPAAARSVASSSSNPLMANPAAARSAGAFSSGSSSTRFGGPTPNFKPLAPLAPLPPLPVMPPSAPPRVPAHQYSSAPIQPPPSSSSAPIAQPPQQAKLSATAADDDESKMSIDPTPTDPQPMSRKPDPPKLVDHHAPPPPSAPAAPRVDTDVEQQQKIAHIHATTVRAEKPVHADGVTLTTLHRAAPHAAVTLVSFPLDKGTSMVGAPSSTAETASTPRAPGYPTSTSRVNAIRRVYQHPHAHLVQFEVGPRETTTPGGKLCVFVIRALADGVSLAQYLREHPFGKLPLGVARDVFRQVALAARHLHAIGVVHRDIKPEHIWLKRIDEGTDNSSMYAETVRFHVTLAGVQLLYPCATAAGVVPPLTHSAGTPLYSAPEMFAGQSYGAPVDVWALGVTLFVMATGRMPFWGKDMAAMAQVVVFGKVPLQALDSGVFKASGMHALLRRMLDRNQFTRFTMDDVCESAFFLNEVPASSSSSSS
ncbi:hypothetical protein H9P43_000165 [Blastocladiella emersonii ATCC 22665]|nr:hypothetical protein H9P43_000165 [Blastocladiella emersonii ATCC 22665]